MIVCDFYHDGDTSPFVAGTRHIAAELPAVPSKGDTVWFDQSEFAVSSVAWTIGSDHVSVYLT